MNLTHNIELLSKEDQNYMQDYGTFLTISPLSRCSIITVITLRSPSPRIYYQRRRYEEDELQSYRSRSARENEHKSQT